MKTYIGIDNGVTGTIGVVGDTYNITCKTPVALTQDYTKSKKNINRIDVVAFRVFLESLSDFELKAVLERPMVNPGRFQATASALRCLEAQLVVLEMMGIPYMFVDSKEWQKALLPSGCIGDVELKLASLSIGNRLYPQYKDFKHKDRDGLLIAHYAFKKQL